MTASTTRNLNSIVARAAAPSERISFGGFSPQPHQQATIDSRVRQWIDGVAAGDREFMGAVLAVRDHHESDFRASLADVEIDRDGALPEWVEVLHHLLDDVAEFTASGWRPDLPTLRDGIPLAFEALLPFVYSGAIFLDRAISLRSLQVDDDARAQILRTLEGRLLSTTMHVFDDEVRTGAAAARLWGGTDAYAPGGSEQAWFDRLDRYPVLGRLIAITYRNWSQLMTELLDRLAADRALLEVTLFGGRPLGTLVGFGGDAGDLHEQGRAVAILTFDHNRSVVYKPKDLRIADRFQILLEICNRQGLCPPLPVRTVIPRDGYAWEEFVADGPCRSEAEVADFYLRMGMFARLLQLLGARDFWFDNVIAAGPMPALIDLETAIQQRPRTPQTRLSSTEMAAYDLLEESAVNIGLIAHCTPIKEGTPAEDIGAMTPPRQFTTPFHFEYSDSVGELLDPVLSADGFVQWRKTDYAPTLNGEPVAAADYFDAVEQGYRIMHRHLADNRAALAAPDGPLAGLGSVPVRHIQRDTWSCMKIINSSLRSPLLVDGLRREHFLEGVLRSAVLGGTADAISLTALNSEIDAFRDLDIPLFQSLPAESAVLLRDGRSIPEFFPGTALDRVWKRLREIDQVDVDEQVDLMRSNLSTGAHPPRRFEAAAVAASFAPKHQAVDWLGQAVELGDLILSRAVVGPDGDLSWLGVTNHPLHALRSVEVLRPDVLTGTCGLAMLFANLHQATGLPRFAEAASGALGSTRQIMTDAPRLFAALRLDPGRSDSLSCGRWYGIGSQINAMRCVGIGIGDRTLVDLASDYVAALDIDEIVRRAPVDLVGGIAGLLTVLLPGAGSTEPPSIAALGLLDAVLARLEASHGIGASSYPDSPGPLSALPSGAGGVLLALDQARPFTDDARRRRVDQWAHVLIQDRPRPAGGYQQLLVRLARAPRQADGQLVADAIEFVHGDLHERTSEQLLEVVEISLGASVATGDQEQRDRARAAADVLLGRHAVTGHWFPESHAADRHNLSILTGVGAVAHAFLRCHDAVRIPSVRTIW